MAATALNLKRLADRQRGGEQVAAGLLSDAAAPITWTYELSLN